MDREIESEISAVFQKLYNFYKEKNIEGMSSLYNNQIEPLIIGTAEDEIGFGEKEIMELQKREIAEIDDVKNINFKINRISVKGSIVWCFLSLSMDLKLNSFQSPFLINIRSTVILERVNNKWLINHIHNSSSDPQIQTGRSMPTLEGIEVTIKNWIDNFDVNLNLLHLKHKDQLKKYLLMAKEIIQLED